MTQKKLTSHFIWKYLERCSYQGILLVINVILARILTPEHFGVLAIIMVFVNLGQSLVQNGLATSLIQENRIEDEDVSNCLYVNVMVSSVLYIALYGAAPYIARWYEIPSLTGDLRVMGIVLFPGAVNAVQNALIVRDGMYKPLFFCGFISVLFSGAIGILAAANGMGVMSLIWQQLSLNCILCLLLIPFVGIRLKKPSITPKFVRMCRFGFRLTLSGFINTLYENILALMIGKVYTKNDLGYYNQGRNYPYFIIANVNTSLNTVILPVFAQKGDRAQIKELMQSTICISTFVMFPLLFGLGAVSQNLVTILLTEQWISCVPYLCLFCLIFAFYPLSTVNLQAYNAIGRSDFYLKNEIWKKIVGVLFLVLSMLIWDTPLAVVASLLITSPISVWIDTMEAKNQFDYPMMEQVMTCLPNLLNAVCMVLIVSAVDLLPLAPLPTLCIQVLVGSVVYTGLSAFFHMKGYYMTLSIIKTLLSRK